MLEETTQLEQSSQKILHDSCWQQKYSNVRKKQQKHTQKNKQQINSAFHGIKNIDYGSKSYSSVIGNLVINSLHCLISIFNV